MNPAQGDLILEKQNSLGSWLKGQVGPLPGDPTEQVLVDIDREEQLREDLESTLEKLLSVSELLSQSRTCTTVQGALDVSDAKALIGAAIEVVTVAHSLASSSFPFYGGRSNGLH